MKKQAYTKPTMQVVTIQQQHIICTSTGSYEDQSLQMRGGQNNQINDENAVW